MELYYNKIGGSKYTGTAHTGASKKGGVHTGASFTGAAHTGAGKYVKCPHCGGSFWNDFKDGFMSVVNPVKDVAGSVLSLIPDPRAQMVGSVLKGLGKPKKPVSANDPRKIRGAKISAIMRKAKQAGRPITLGEASRILANN